MTPEEDDSRPMTRITVAPGAILRGFAVAIVVLGIMHVIGQGMRHVVGTHSVYGLVDQFDLANEGNLPTFVSALQLLACAWVLALIGLARRAQRDRTAFQWLALSILLLYLAADEASGLHELLIRPVREALPGLATGLFYWAWVIPGTVAALATALAFARFVRHTLPPPIRRRWLLGALVFVVGAIGVEMPEAWHVQVHGQENLTYGFYVLVEEMLEMAGVLILLSGILRYWTDELGPIAIDPRPARTADRTVSGTTPSATTARSPAPDRAARSR